MKNSKFGGLALAVTLALGSGAMAQSPSAGDQRTAQDRIEADYAEAVKRCDEQSGAVKSSCLDNAQRSQTAARADADRQTRNADQRAGAATGQGEGTDRMTQDAQTLLFDFGSAELRPDGRAALDSFIAEMQRSDGDQIEVTGHTDRIGSDDVNQALSERRAETVREYLRSEGIEANRVNTTGKGSAQPETTARDCEGERSRDVINCLQPDRRVTLAAAGPRNNR